MNFKRKFIQNDIHISNKNKILETGCLILVTMCYRKQATM